VIGRRWVASLALAACVAGGGGACGDDRAAPDPPTTVPAAPLREAAAGLCTARQQARTDVNTARTTFYDRSHDALHTLAGALAPVDRDLAARLLESKQRVEAGLRGAGSASGELVADLGTLAEVTRRGLDRVSIAVPPCS
jgi:hypothetical protein